MVSTSVTWMDAFSSSDGTDPQEYMKRTARKLAASRHTLAVFFMGILLSAMLNIADGGDEFKPASPLSQRPAISDANTALRP